MRPDSRPGHSRHLPYRGFLPIQGQTFHVIALSWKRVLRILRHEVGFASQAEDITLLTHDFSLRRHLRWPYDRHAWQRPAYPFSRMISWARAKSPSASARAFFTVHHTGTGHFAELHYICSFDFHSLGFNFVELRSAFPYPDHLGSLGQSSHGTETSIISVRIIPLSARSQRQPRQR